MTRIVESVGIVLHLGTALLIFKQIRSVKPERWSLVVSLEVIPQNLSLHSCKEALSLVSLEVIPLSIPSFI